MNHFRLTLIRNLNSGSLIESFLVSAVATILVIRFYLQLTGYPQIGGGGLHIAHMLWGGLLMLVAIFLLLLFLNRIAANLAAILGGIGFGTFIDELGKFITHDNNYFFEPTIALIYVIFIIIYLGLRLVVRKSYTSSKEYLVNTLEIAKEVVISGLDTQKLKQARGYLQKADAQDPISQVLTALFGQFEVLPESKNLLSQINQKLQTLYQKVTQKKWFVYILVAFFIGQSLIALSHSVITTDIIKDYLIPDQFRSEPADHSFEEFGEVFFGVISSIFIIIGVIILLKSRLAGYQMFKRAILVSIFLTQFFNFYDVQFEALFELVFNLILLVILNDLINREKAYV